LICCGPETFEEIKTYDKEEWKNSLDQDFVSKARLNNIKKLQDQYDEVRKELIKILSKGLDEDAVKIGSVDKLSTSDITNLNLEKLKEFIITQRAILKES